MRALTSHSSTTDAATTAAAAHMLLALLVVGALMRCRGVQQSGVCCCVGCAIDRWGVAAPGDEGGVVPHTLPKESAGAGVSLVVVQRFA